VYIVQYRQRYSLDCGQLHGFIEITPVLYISTELKRYVVITIRPIIINKIITSKSETLKENNKEKKH